MEFDAIYLPLLILLFQDIYLFNVFDAQIQLDARTSDQYCVNYI